MLKNPAKISVLMPVYNTPEEYLREAIESILNQTYKDFEFVILNDGSINNAEDVILSYQDDRIKYFKNEVNSGLPNCRNKLLELANCEYIAYMDSDDISLPQRLEKQIEFLEHNTNVDILATRMQRFPKTKFIDYPILDKEIKLSLIFEYNVIANNSVMFKSELVKKGYIHYDENITNAEDYALWLSLIDKVHFHNLSEYLVKYRWHKSNISKTGANLQSLNAQYVMIKAQAKYFNLDGQKMLEMIDKLKNGQKIKSLELKALEEFVKLVNFKIEENKIDCSYNLNRNFYKYALKICKKDMQYLNILWKSELNKFAQIRSWTKIENTVRIL